MPPRPRLYHLHLATPIPYLFATHLQNQLLALHRLSRLNPSKHKAPPPTVISFTSFPTYTLGRREAAEGKVSEEQLNFLKEKVCIARRADDWSRRKVGGQSRWGEEAEVVKTERGGQITFHGPGQVVFYPVFALDAAADELPLVVSTSALSPSSQSQSHSQSHSQSQSQPPSPPPSLLITEPETEVKSKTRTTSPSSLYRLRPHSYISLLEQTTISLLSQFGISSKTTENPGVWINDLEKIAAVGVHLRRFVVSYGVAVNVTTDLEWFERIVACGLVGKEMVSMEKVLERRLDAEGIRDGKGVGGEVGGGGLGKTGLGLDLEDVANRWVDEFATRLGFDVEDGAVIRDLKKEGNSGNPVLDAFLWNWWRSGSLGRKEEVVHGEGGEGDRGANV